MSYIRYNSPLWYFKGKSDSYVFTSGIPGDEDYFVDDYDDEFKDTPTLIEVIADVMLRECKDERWVEKIVRILAERTGCSKRLRERKLTVDEWFNELDKNLEEFTKSDRYKKFKKEISDTDISPNTGC